MSPPIFNPDGSEVSEIVLPDGSTASEVIDPDGNVVFEAEPDIPDSVLTQDLVAWYRFEDGDARDYTNDLDATFADSTAYDGIVNNQTYQSSAGVTDFKTGSNSGAFEFNGGSGSSGTAITFPDVINGNDNISAMCWVNVSNINDGNLYALSLRESQYFEFGGANGDWLFKAGGNDNTSTVSNSAVSNTWVHLALTTSSSTATCYVNGSNVSTFSIGSRNGNEANTIGGRKEEQYVDGLIDDVRVYNRELTASEINDIYNATEP